MRNVNRAASVRLRGGTALRALALLGVSVGGLAASAIPAAAQDFTNVTATGRVTDQSGKPIPGATVTVTSDAQGFSRTVTTDSGGTYRVRASDSAGRLYVRNQRRWIFALS